jgi:hypothetical protein
MKSHGKEAESYFKWLNRSFFVIILVYISIYLLQSKEAFVDYFRFFLFATALIVYLICLGRLAILQKKRAFIWVGSAMIFGPLGQFVTYLLMRDTMKRVKSASKKAPETLSESVIVQTNGQERDSHINIEHAIREYHTFEDKMKKFLDLASVMTERELELALGRLADILVTQGDNNIHVRARGEILKIYYDLRKKGQKKYRSVRRTIGPWPTMTESLVLKVSTYQLLPENTQSIPESASGITLAEMVELLSP